MTPAQRELPGAVPAIYEGDAEMGERICSIEGCDKRLRSATLCAMHYGRWLRWGDPLYCRYKTFGSGRCLTSQGYVELLLPDHPLAAPSSGYVAEHRKVWFDTHGPIPDGHHIHHLNGVKDDNRLENLELRSIASHTKEHHPWDMAHRPRYARTCDECGQPFMAWTSVGRWCSRRCSNRYHGRHRRR